MKECLVTGVTVFFSLACARVAGAGVLFYRWGFFAVTTVTTVFPYLFREVVL